jgi:hypothetical protein
MSFYSKKTRLLKRKPNKHVQENEKIQHENAVLKIDVVKLQHAGEVSALHYKLEIANFKLARASHEAARSERF